MKHHRDGHCCVAESTVSNNHGTIEGSGWSKDAHCDIRIEPGAGKGGKLAVSEWSKNIYSANNFDIRIESEARWNMYRTEPLAHQYNIGLAFSRGSASREAELALSRGCASREAIVARRLAASTLGLGVESDEDVNALPISFGGSSINSGLGADRANSVKPADGIFAQDARPLPLEGAEMPFSPQRACASQKERQHVCKVCNGSFACASNLKVHMRIHTGERPFVCKECGASFTQSSHHQLHLRIHTGEKPHVCEVCGAAFTQSRNLLIHTRTHTGEKPYVCKECGSAFTQMSNYNVHLRIHTGEKPYVCNECGAAFAQSSNYKAHMRTHLGIKPFTCNECGAAFAQSSNCKVHMKTHSSETTSRSKHKQSKKT